VRKRAVLLRKVLTGIIAESENGIFQSGNTSQGTQETQPHGFMRWIIPPIELKYELKTEDNMRDKLIRKYQEIARRGDLTVARRVLRFLLNKYACLGISEGDWVFSLILEECGVNGTHGTRYKRYRI